MYEDILIPYDGSDEARRGAEHAVELAAELDSTAHGLYVIDLPGAPRALSIRDDEEQLRAEYEAHSDRVLEELSDLAATQGVPCETDVRSGSVAEEIVRFAADEGMDVIVMASAYRGKIGNLLGGTTDKVVRTATVPVVSQRMDANDI